MSIQVNDFQWEPGKNDAEYIKLLKSSRDEWQKIAQKAIAKLKTLSKAQEPRVMTYNDFIDNPNMGSQGFLPAWIEYRRDGEWGEYWADDDDEWSFVKADNYNGYGWRCWTSRPDEKRRAETPWN